MQAWQRWREPLAIALLVASVLMLVLRGVALGLAIDAGNAGGLLGGLPGQDDLLVLATALAVLWCATPVRDGQSENSGDDADRASATRLSPHAWPITVAGVVVVGLTVLGWLALSLLNVVELVSWPTPDVGYVVLVADGLLRLAVPVASAVAVISAVRRVAAARTRSGEGRPALAGSAPTEARNDEESSAAPQLPAVPERLPASWQADEATGAVWLTADDAAQGRPGLSWSDPGGAGAASAGSWSAVAPDHAAEDSVPPRETGADVAPPGRPFERPAADDDDLR